MAGRPRQDRRSIKAAVVATRFPANVVELLDALVAHERLEIEAAGLAGKVNRASLLESLIVGKAKKLGLVRDERGMPKGHHEPETHLEGTANATVEPKKKAPKKSVYTHLRENAAREYREKKP